MLLFTTRTTHHLANNISLPGGAYTLTHLSDGELYVRIDEDVRNKQVWVLAGTQPPAEHILELFFLLDALQGSGAIINLIITYFAYGRQVIPTAGAALSAAVISSFLQQCKLAKMYCIHPHSLLLENYLPYAPLFYYDFFYAQAQNYDTIVAPDQGAAALAQHIAAACKKELIVLKKIRTKDNNNVEIIADDVQKIEKQIVGKKILLVDDIIATGNTLHEAAGWLKKHGAHTLGAAATHGIFCSDAHELLARSPLEKIFVTNTLPQLAHEKVTVVDISTFVQNHMVSEFLSATNNPSITEYCALRD